MDNPVNGVEDARARSEHRAAVAWERRVALLALSGALWLSIAGAALLTLAGIAVPHELYYLGTASFGALDMLLTPTRPSPPRQGA